MMRRLTLAAAWLVALAGVALAGGSTAPGIVQSGTVAPGNCAQFSANGVAIDSGGTCGTGTAGVIQSTGTSNQVLVNGNTSSHTGATTYSLPNAVIIGANGTAAGTFGLQGSTGGTVTLQPGAAAAGTYNFNLPTSAGTSGQPLLSGGGGSTAQTYGTLSVGGGGTGLTSGTSGGVPYFSSSSAILSSTALIANLPVLGGGAGSAPISGSVSGNTTTFATTSGSLTSGRCIQADASGNLVQASAGCGSSTLTSAHLFVGNGSNVATDVALSGDATLANTGAITVTKTNGVNFGTAATQNTGTSGANVPLMNGANTWSGTQTFATIGGYLATVTTDATTTRTLGATDCGTFIKFTSASAVTVTLPNSLSVGCQVAIEQAGAGQVTLTAGSGASLNSAHSYTKTFGQFAVVGVTVDGNSGGSSAVYAMTGDGA